jgi:phosphoglycolate phosphatase-like HAD superfamily hydrolase
MKNILLKNKLAIFDLDGTILDVSRRHYSLVSDFLDEVGEFDYSIDDYLKDRGLGKSDIQILSTRFKLPDSKIINFQNFKDRNIETSDYLTYDKINNNVITLLDILKKKGYRLEILTARKNYENLANQVLSLRLMGMFDNIMMWPKDLYEKSAYVELLTTKHKKILIFGDSKDDYLASKGLHSQFVLIENKMFNQNFVKNQVPKSFDYLVRNLHELGEKT